MGGGTGTGDGSGMPGVGGLNTPIPSFLICAAARCAGQSATTRSRAVQINARRIGRTSSIDWDSLPANAVERKQSPAASA